MANMLKNIISLEGKKTTTKGASLEALIVADIMKSNRLSISKVLSDFVIDSTTHDLNQLRFPQVEHKLDDETIVSERPVNVFFRPSRQFRPNILAFLSKDVWISFKHISSST